ncbi:MAG: hypothetical protein JWN73_3439 [Betaproteobacteria bacterium]|nr:hypothetical protein [Betaproteobacteria bacterium]
MIVRAAHAAFSAPRLSRDPMTLSPRTRLFLSAVCLLIASTAGAAAPQVHLTTDAEFIGVWKSIPVPLSQQPPESQANPFLRGDCNYLVHSAHNNWDLVVIESYPGNEKKALDCSLTASEVMGQAMLLPDSLRFHWEHKEALFRMTGSTGSGGFIWMVQTVDGDGEIAVDAQSAGVAVKRGDLVMQMANRSVNKVLWRMVLRKVTR